MKEFFSFHDKTLRIPRIEEYFMLWSLQSGSSPDGDHGELVKEDIVVSGHLHVRVELVHET